MQDFNLEVIFSITMVSGDNITRIIREEIQSLS